MPRLGAGELADIQGIIVSGYKHLPYGALLFVEIRDAQRGRAWLEVLRPRVTTSAHFADTNAPSPRRSRPPWALNVAFSYSGLHALGIGEATLRTFPTAFREGMAARSNILGDIGASAPGNWDLGGPHTAPLHAVLILFAPDQSGLDQLQQEHRRTINETQGGVVEASIQTGAFTGTEHFGFSDGIANPLIEGTRGHDLAGGNVVRTGEFVLGYWDSYDLYPQSPSVPLADDPGALLPPFPDDALNNCRDLGRSGSYIAYRKLRQDVAGFWAFVEKAADDSGGDGDAVYLASKLVGRWPSGAPLALAPDRDDPALGRDSSRNNSFGYAGPDPMGYGCPVGAHIRTSNPRDSLVGNSAADALKTTNRHRILRRAVYFGDALVTAETLRDGRPPTGLTDDGQERGIHFFAVSGDLKRQFEFIQQSWQNDGHFNGLFNDKDPIVGNNDGTGRMTIPRAGIRRQLLEVPRFVTVAGGGYFFVPGLRALRFLAASG